MPVMVSGFFHPGIERATSAASVRWLLAQDARSRKRTIETVPCRFARFSWRAISAGSLDKRLTRNSPTYCYWFTVRFKNTGTAVFCSANSCAVRSIFDPNPGRMIMGASGFASRRKAPQTTRSIPIPNQFPIEPRKSSTCFLAADSSWARAIAFLRNSIYIACTSGSFCILTTSSFAFATSGSSDA
jgi:hypothetical protein